MFYVPMSVSHVRAEIVDCTAFAYVCLSYQDRDKGLYYICLRLSGRETQDIATSAPAIPRSTGTNQSDDGLDSLVDFVDNTPPEPPPPRNGCYPL